MIDPTREMRGLFPDAFQKSSLKFADIDDFIRKFEPATSHLDKLLRSNTGLEPAFESHRALLRSLEPGVSSLERHIEQMRSLFRTPTLEMLATMQPIGLALEQARQSQLMRLASVQDEIQRSTASLIPDAASFHHDLQRTLNSMSLLSPIARFREDLVSAADALHSSFSLGGMLHTNSFDAAAGVLACWNADAHAVGVTTSEDPHRSLLTRGLSLELSATLKPHCSRCGKQMPVQRGTLQIDLASLFSLGLEVEIPIFPMCECLMTAWDGTSEGLMQSPAAPLRLTILAGASEGDGRPRALLCSVDPADDDHGS